MTSNNSCGTTTTTCGTVSHGCGNGFLIVVVLYILLAIILGSCFFV